MPEPLPDTWHSRDLPVLREVVRLLDETIGAPVRATEVETNLAMTEDDVQRAGLALETAGLVQVEGVDQLAVLFFSDVSASARRAAGAWPTPESALDRMVAALEAIAANTDDEDTRTKARKLLDGITGAGRSIALAATTAAVTGQIPGS